MFIEIRPFLWCFCIRLRIHTRTDLPSRTTIPLITIIRGSARASVGKFIRSIWYFSYIIQLLLTSCHIPKPLLRTNSLATFPLWCNESKNLRYLFSYSNQINNITIFAKVSRVSFTNLFPVAFYCSVRPNILHPDPVLGGWPRRKHANLYTKHMFLQDGIGSCSEFITLLGEVLAAV